MIPYQIIMKKRDGGILSADEIKYFVEGYTTGTIPDYQMSALLMAIFIRGMNDVETTELTLAMMRSGEVLNLSCIPGVKVDKHSTGGVGDKVSLILAPLVAVCGVPIPMLSGRGLGHTGGTLDKLESIPGFRTRLSIDEFISNVKNVGFSIIGQTAKLAPADGKMYSLRDVTATVDSIPLIAGSIMSKKLAAGPDAFVFDVKTGSGAFMREIDKARELAKTLVSIAKNAGRKAVALITDMNQPLGNKVGNSLEIEETIECLENKGPKDLMEITLSLSSWMLVLGEKAKNLEEAREKLTTALQSGKGLEKFKEFVKVQGGNLDALPKAKFKLPIESPQSGFLAKIDTFKVGMSAVALGAGRIKSDDSIDPSVGFVFHKKLGDKISKGEPIADIYYNSEEKAKAAKEEILSACTISSDYVSPPPLIYEVIT